MKIVVGDAATLGTDLDLSHLSALGEVEIHQATAQAEIRDRFAGAQVAVINKLKMNAETLGDVPTLKLITLCATGFDNVDLDYCRTHGIAVANVRGYSTDSVAQLTMAMLLSLACNLPQFCEHTRSGAYTEGGVANCLVPVYRELRGKTVGVVGLGNIGRQVAAVSSALGCEVIGFSRTEKEGYTCVPLPELCRRADFITVHLPLSPETRGIIGREELALMKRGAILINVARGAVTDEAAVAEAILQGQLGGFGADVYSEEPFSASHPFYAIRHLPNVCLTPHMAWGAKEARERCLAEVAENIRAFARGERRCRVD